MKCIECKRLKRLANTDECGQGICSYGYSWEPIDVNNECVFKPKELTCKDCSHYYYDDACMTVEENDPVIIDGHMCCGYEDNNENKLYTILADWTLRGYNIQDKLNSVLDRFNKEFEIPFQPIDEIKEDAKEEDK